MATSAAPLNTMATPAATDYVRPVTPAAPPWLWLWIAFFITSLPGLADEWGRSLDQISLMRDSKRMLRRFDPDYGRLDFLLYPSILLDVLPATALLIGLALTLAPQIRAGYVRRRYRLAPLPATLAAVQEIEAFVHDHAPGLRLVGNLRRQDTLAFVYPEGYRRSALALFGSFVRLWVSDRPAAEAVLLHEIGHYRRGDTRVIGVGSLFETVVRWALPAYAVLFLLPAIVLFIDQRRQAGAELTALGIPATQLWQHQLGLGQATAANLAATTLAYLFFIARFFITPLAAVWSAEFVADRHAADIQGDSGGVCRAMSATEGRVRPWRWLLARLSHPPVRLRRWMVTRDLQTLPIWLAILFPFTYLVLRPLVLHAWAVPQYYVIDYSAGAIWDASLDNTRWYFRTIAKYLIPMAALLLLWPFIGRYWETLMTGERGVSSRAGAAQYSALALALGFCSIVGFALR